MVMKTRKTLQPEMMKNQTIYIKNGLQTVNTGQHSTVTTETRLAIKTSPKSVPVTPAEKFQRAVW